MHRDAKRKTTTIELELQQALRGPARRSDIRCLLSEHPTHRSATLLEPGERVAALGVHVDLQSIAGVTLRYLPGSAQVILTDCVVPLDNTDRLTGSHAFVYQGKN